MKKEIDELEKEIDELEKEKDELEEEKDELEEAKVVLEKEKDEIGKLNMELNEELEKIKIKNVNLEKDLKKEKSENDNLEKELKNKREELYEEKLNSDKLKNQIELNKTINNNLEKDYNNIKVENDKLLKKIKNIENNEIKKIQKENKDLKIENDNLKKESKNVKSKKIDLEKQIKTKCNLIEKKTKENKDLINRRDNLIKELNEERKKRFELEDKLDENENENNNKFNQTFNNFYQRANLTDRKPGRNKNYLLDSLNNERQYNNYSYTLENDTCFKCRINSDKLEKIELENKSMKKKIDELEKKNKMLTFENNTLSENKNSTENYEKKSSLINYIINKGLNQNSQICEKYKLDNKYLIIELIQEGNIISEKVADVMLEVDRGNFAPKFPYANRPISINYNVTISAPHMHAFALEHLLEYCTPNSRILDVGSGSGFLTLALSKMANDTAIVVGIEHIQELYNFGIENVEKYNSDLIKKKKIIFVNGDGRKGYKIYSPYKAIHVGAASEIVPQALVDQLDYNGRMFIPIGKKGQTQDIYLVDKDFQGNVTYKSILSVCYGMLTDIQSQLNNN